MEILKRIEYECYGMFLMESIASRKGGGGGGLNSGKANVQLPKAVNRAIDSLMARAKAVSGEVQGMAVDIAKKYGAKVTPINLKGKESIERKVKAGDKVADIKDAVRTTIVASKEDIPKILRDLGADSRHIRTKVQTADKFDGYSGNIVNVKVGKVVAEIQVNTPKMIYAKEPPARAAKILGRDEYLNIKRSTGYNAGEGHMYYEQSRGGTTKGRRNKQGVRQASRRYYSVFS